MKVENLQTSGELTNSSAPLHPRKGIFFLFHGSLDSVDYTEYMFCSQAPGIHSFFAYIRLGITELYLSLCVCLIIAS